MTSLKSILSLSTLFVAFALLAACSPSSARIEPTDLPITLIAPNELPTSTFDDPVLVEGQQLYNTLCGHCHGYDGEGQLEASVEQTLALGMHLVPAHDHTGHTWQHPDQLLIESIKEGIQNPLDHYPMPAYGEGLTDEQIVAILEYIKLWWTDEQRSHQAALTATRTALDEAIGFESD